METVLVEESEDQPDATEAHEVERAHAGAHGVAAHGAEQAQIEQWLVAGGDEVALPLDEADEEHAADREQPPQPAEAAGVRLDQRIHEREDAESEEQDAGHVHAPTPGTPDARQETTAEQDGENSDGDVDVEDPPPARGPGRQREDGAAGDGTGGGGDADGRAEEAEGPTAFGAPEHLLDERGVLGGHETGRQALGKAGHHQQHDVGGHTAGGAADYEAAERQQEDATPVQGVTEAPSGDQGEGEREGVPGHHPLHLRG